MPLTWGWWLGRLAERDEALTVESRLDIDAHMGAKRTCLVSVLVLAIGGCASTELFEGKVKTRAEFDMGCSDLELVDLGGGAYGVRGCGKQTSYVLVPKRENACTRLVFKGYAENHCAAVLNSDEKPGPSGGQ